MDCADELCHYLACPVLWLLASGTCRFQGSPIMRLPRLCIHQPTLLKLEIFVFGRDLYHQRANDRHCMRDDGMPGSGPIVQNRTAETACKLLLSSCWRQGFVPRLVQCVSIVELVVGLMRIHTLNQ